MKLYVARHGETEWNAQGRICGRTDIPLTERGEAQAKALAEKMADKGIDLIIASPMIRARQTAAAVSQEIGIPVLTDDRLIEQDYGIYEGKDRLDAGFLANKRRFAYRYPGGESMMAVAHRVYGLLEELKTRCPGKTILLVCHGGVCRIICTYFEDLDTETLAGYSPDNASLAEYEM